LNRSPSRKQAGPAGEAFAAQFLKRKGFRLLERNYRSRWGEIDLICQKGGILVFVEVKTRTSLASGHPLEAITPWKRDRLLRTGQCYLLAHRAQERPYRFDLVAIVWDSTGTPPQVSHLENVLEES
jgi:putative endonuclease